LCYIPNRFLGKPHIYPSPPQTLYSNCRRNGLTLGVIRFVSDVTPPDIGHLFSALSNSAYFFADEEAPDTTSLEFLVQALTSFYADGRIIIRPHDFWTTQHSFWRLPTKAPDLLADLEESDLLVFKGDLNYRKYVPGSPLISFQNPPHS
jgi:Damage-control phosphatase ARMT1-like domain